MNSHVEVLQDDQVDLNTTHAGTCFCGAVEITVTGRPIEMGYCHCESCRSYSGAPVTAFVLWHANQVEVTRGKHSLSGFQKSAMSDRRFCALCGGHVLAYHPSLGLTDVHAAVLPTLAFVPSVHLNYAETVLPIRDGLPKLSDFPSAVGGSGNTLPE